MTCLYGDSSPFPLGEGFLETLRDLTTAAVALLRFQATAERADKSLQKTKNETDTDQQWLAQLGSTVQSAISAHHRSGASQAAVAEAARLADAVAKFIDAARQNIAAGCEVARRDLDASIVKQRSAATQTLERFLTTHTLPQTVWGISWRAPAASEELATAEALAMTGCGIEASFILDIPDPHRWARATRVGDLFADFSLRVPVKGGKLRRQKLAKMYISAIDYSPKQLKITMQPKRRNDKGFEIVASSIHDPTIRAAGPDGQPFVLESADAEMARHLAAEVRASLRPLVSRRAEVKQITLGDKSVAEVAGETAKVMIEAVAPIVRELVSRSSACDELSLKRDLGNGRREEVFLPVATLTKRIDTLPTPQRQAFDSFGLPEISQEALEEDDEKGEDTRREVLSIATES